MSAGQGTQKLAAIAVLGSNNQNPLSKHFNKSKMNKQALSWILDKIKPTHNHDPAKTGTEQRSSLNNYE